jgi:hypothetical protein
MHSRSKGIPERVCIILCVERSRGTSAVTRFLFLTERVLSPHPLKCCRCLGASTVTPYRASVQLSEKASALVLKGRPSRSVGHALPLASTPLRESRVPSAGIKIVHTP